MQGSLPQKSESQQIGHWSQKSSNGQTPETWRPKALDGTDDYGFDYQVQTVIYGFVRNIFRIRKNTLRRDDKARGLNGLLDDEKDEQSGHVFSIQ
jgi:hypothetical protein